MIQLTTGSWVRFYSRVSSLRFTPEGCMMLKRIIALTLISSGLVGLGAAFAEDDSRYDENAQSMSSWLLAKYDLNGDEAISAKEISSKKHKVFRYLDSDQDGNVDIDEYMDGDAKRREAILKARFDKLDLDHDGRVDQEEYSSYLGQFANIDHDGDGNLSQAEVMATQVAEAPNSHCLWVFCVKTGN